MDNIAEISQNDIPGVSQKMELINDLAEYFICDEDNILILNTRGSFVFFYVGGTEYVCQTVHGGKRLKARSITISRY